MEEVRQVTRQTFLREIGRDHESRGAPLPVVSGLKTGPGVAATLNYDPTTEDIEFHMRVGGHQPPNVHGEGRAPACWRPSLSTVRLGGISFTDYLLLYPRKKSKVA